MKFICTEDIENLAAQGKKELVVDGNTVVIELARDMARQLGITIVDRSQLAPVQPASSASPSTSAKPPSPVASSAASSSLTRPTSSVSSSAPTLDSRPKGCQHGPLPVTARSEQPKSSQNPDGVVDQLVELVRQSAGKHSGN